MTTGTCQTLIDLKSLRELFNVDPSFMSAFSTEVGSYLILRYGNKFPSNQLVVDLKNDFDYLFATFTWWTEQQVTLQGLDIDVSALLGDNTEIWETPDTTTSSSQWSAKNIFTRPHTEGYMKYLADRLLMDPSFLDEKFDLWTSNLWTELGKLTTYKRCY